MRAPLHLEYDSDFASKRPVRWLATNTGHDTAADCVLSSMQPRARYAGSGRRRAARRDTVPCLQPMLEDYRITAHTRRGRPTGASVSDHFIECPDGLEYVIYTKDVYVVPSNETEGQML